MQTDMHSNWPTDKKDTHSPTNTQIQIDFCLCHFDSDSWQWRNSFINFFSFFFFFILSCISSLFFINRSGPWHTISLLVARLTFIPICSFSRFTSSVDPTWGHFIESINDVMSVNGFYWFIFDNSTRMLTPVGKIDSLFWPKRRVSKPKERGLISIKSDWTNLSQT